MNIINLDSSAEGKILKKDITDKSGRVLSAAGTQLTCDIVKGLEGKGVSKVEVVSGEDTGAQRTYSETEIKKIREESRMKLEQKFFEPPEGLWMKALFEAVLEDMIERQM